MIIKFANISKHDDHGHGDLQTRPIQHTSDDADHRHHSSAKIVRAFRRCAAGSWPNAQRSARATSSCAVAKVPRPGTRTAPARQTAPDGSKPAKPQVDGQRAALA